MKSKTKKDWLSPWQINEENYFSEKFVSVVLQSKGENCVGIKQINNEALKEEIQKQKVLESARKMKQKKQNAFQEKLSTTINKLEQIKMKPSRPLKLIKSPLNRNLISIISSYKKEQQRSNFESNHKKLSHRKIPFSAQLTTEQISKKKLQKNPQKTLLEKLKQTLLKKRKPSLQTLIKVRQEMDKINQIDEISILRKYSVHNLRLNNTENENRINSQREVLKQLDHQKDIKQFNSTLKSLKALERMRTQTRDINKNILKTQKSHILDKLYDRFY